MDKFIAALEMRKQNNALRGLKVEQGLVDFSSNDYLGFATEFKENDSVNLLEGSTGSRLLTGNTEFAENLEQELAEKFKSESALIFTSGYIANLGLISCVADRNDTIVYDELCHASIRDAIKLSNARSYSFKHNSLEHLKSKLDKATGNIFVVVESVYSMDGDVSPLKGIVDLSKSIDFKLFVDEAHSVGYHGKNGEGLVVELGLEKDVFARVVTFGKALGSHGAMVLGSYVLRDYLINFSRPFIYTTALPKHSLLSIKKAVDLMFSNSYKIIKTRHLSSLFRESICLSNDLVISNQSAIQSVLIPGNNKVKKITEELKNNGFDVRPILSPTVPEGKERIRICLHAFNTEKEVINLCELLNKLV